MDPSVNAPYINVGFLSSRRGETEKAEKYFQKALALVPGDPIVLYNLGTLKADKGKWQEAIRFYEKAIETNPDYVCVYSERTRAYWTLGEKKKAIESLNQGLKRDPTNSMLQNVKRWMEAKLRGGK